MYFVKELFLDGLFADPSAAVAGFADDQAAILMDLSNGAAEIGRVRNVFHSRMGKIAPRDLGAALQQMACGGGDGHFLPIVGRPTQPMADRPHGQRRIRDPATQHDASALGQRLGDSVGPGVDVHRHGVLQGLRGQPSFVTGRCFFQQIITQHAGDFQCREAACQRLAQPLRGRPGIGGAAIGDDRDAGLDAHVQHGLEEIEQTRGVSRLRVQALA